MKTLLYADDLIKATESAKAGFNSFIMGWGEPKSAEYADKTEWYARLQGYQFAERMAKENGIAFVHPFKCRENNCYPFEFGGFFVCNSCGGKGVDRDWWKICVEKDGNAFCCHGLDFEDLQASSNYAFGETFDDAIENYWKVMLSLEKQKA